MTLFSGNAIYSILVGWLVKGGLCSFDGRAQKRRQSVGDVMLIPGGVAARLDSKREESCAPAPNRCLCTHDAKSNRVAHKRNEKKGCCAGGQSRKALPTLLVAAASRKPSKKNIKRESPQLCERTPVRVERKEMEGGCVVCAEWIYRPL